MAPLSTSKEQLYAFTISLGEWKPLKHPSVLMAVLYNRGGVGLEV